MKKIKTEWFVYLLECVNGKVYTGITTDVEARFNKHLTDKGAKFTKMNSPLRIIGTKSCTNRSQASQLEYQVKQLSALQKRVLSLDWTEK
jgi:putative endonuclease